MTRGLSLSLNQYGQNHIVGFTRWGVGLQPPVRSSRAFSWQVLDDEGFERPMFKMLRQRDAEFDNVEWLQKTRANDGGRDLSAIRVENGNRIMVQARHQKASINAPDVAALVVKSETWSPPFDEVMILTTGHFTQEAIRCER